MNITFCICIIFSRFHEKIDSVLRSAFGQDYPSLRIFILDNACPGLDHAQLVETVRLYTIEKNIDVSIHRNYHHEKNIIVFDQCVEASKGCNFTILYPNETFADSGVVTQVSMLLHKEPYLYVFCEGYVIHFFGEKLEKPIKLNPSIILLRADKNLIQGKIPLLIKENLVKRDKDCLNYSSYLMLETLINHIHYACKIKDRFYALETKMYKSIINEITRSKGLWEISENDRTYINYLQEILELFQELGLRKRKWDFALKENLKNILTRASQFSEKKVKIVFFAQEYSVWPSLQSFYDACINDVRFIAQLVYVPFNHENSSEEKYIEGTQIPNERMEPYWKTVYPIVPCTMYELNVESPDIAVFVKPYDFVPEKFRFNVVDKAVRRCLYISYGLMAAAWTLDAQFKTPLANISWKYIVYGDKVKKLGEKHSYNQGKSIVAWGHPKADNYENLGVKRDNISIKWKNKINSRKTILWNTQHTVKEGIGAGTFFKWKEEIFSYFEKNGDIVLLWRPHPLMFGALVNSGLMTKKELEQLIDMVETGENTILDRSPDYRDSFYASDAIITDGTAFLLEYLYTGRPIIFTIKEDCGTIHFQDEICNNVYVAREKGDIIQLLNDISQEIDPHKEKRISFADNLFKVNPESNGEYIKNQIYLDLEKECKELLW